jgi:hypothetical protein
MGIIDDIKNDSIKNGSKVQSTESAKMEVILNKLFYLPKDVDEEVKFVKQVMTRGLESQERVGLHASAMIVSDKQFCIRQQVLSLIFKQLQGEQLPVSLMRIFEEGNAIHEKWQRLLIRGGYAKAKTLDRTRMDSEYQISFTPDIVCKIPEFYDGAMIGEIKSVNPFQFKKMTSHPKAHSQLQFYMYLCMKAAKEKGVWNGKDYMKGFVLCDDKGGQDFKTFIYDYEPETVAPFIERSEAVTYHFNKFNEEGKMVKRKKECTSYNCKLAEKCPMKDACWNKGMGRIRL